jgi:hypothetical protein
MPPVGRGRAFKPKKISKIGGEKDMTTSLNLKFSASGEKKVSMSYPYADSSCEGAQVKTLMQTIVTNNEIFAEPPLAPTAAEFVTRTVIPVELS